MVCRDVPCAPCAPRRATCRVMPQKLRRSPSWSALNEVIYGRFAQKEDKTFIFLLKVTRTLWRLHRAPAAALDTSMGDGLQ